MIKNNLLLSWLFKLGIENINYRKSMANMDEISSRMKKLVSPIPNDGSNVQKLSSKFAPAPSWSWELSMHAATMNHAIFVLHTVACKS